MQLVQRFYAQYNAPCVIFLTVIFSKNKQTYETESTNCWDRNISGKGWVNDYARQILLRKSWRRIRRLEYNWRLDVIKLRCLQYFSLLNHNWINIECCKQLLGNLEKIFIVSPRLVRYAVRNPWFMPLNGLWIPLKIVMDQKKLKIEERALYQTVNSVHLFTLKIHDEPVTCATSYVAY